MTIPCDVCKTKTEAKDMRILIVPKTDELQYVCKACFGKSADGDTVGSPSHG